MNELIAQNVQPVKDEAQDAYTVSPAWKACREGAG